MERDNLWGMKTGGAAGTTGFMILIAVATARDGNALFSAVVASAIPRVWGYAPKIGCLGPLMLWAGWTAVNVNTGAGLIAGCTFLFAWLMFFATELIDFERYRERKDDQKQGHGQAEEAARARDEAGTAQRKREQDQARRTEEHIRRAARECGISDAMLDLIRTAAGGDRGRVLHTVLRYAEEQRRRGAEQAREGASRQEAKKREEVRRRAGEQERRREHARQGREDRARHEHENQARREREESAKDRQRREDAAKEDRKTRRAAAWAYEALHVPFDAPPTECRQAYRRRAMATHPDRNPNDPNAAAEFQRVKAAWNAIERQGEESS